MLCFTWLMYERCLYFNLNALTRRVNKIWDQAFQEFGLSPAHAYLLRLVLESPGIAQQTIANELKLEKSTVARFVEVLEKKDFLFRKKSGREQLVYPTRAAESINGSLAEQCDKLYQKMIKSLGKTNMTGLVEDLRSTGNKLE